MMRLIWKEMRERWLLHLLWTLAMIVVFLMDYKIFFGGSEYLFEGNNFQLFLIISLFVGCSAYNSELTRDRIFFAYSRPIAWWKLLIAKIIPGAIVILITPIILFFIYYQFFNACYSDYISWHSVIRNLLIVFSIYFAFYLAGISSSIVLPGITGALFTAVITYILVILSVSFINTYFSYGSFIDELTVFWLVSAGIIVSGIILARYAARLKLIERIKCYFKIIGIVVIAGCIISIVANKVSETKYSELQENWEIYSSEISPDSRYALVVYIRNNTVSNTTESMTQLIDIKTGIKSIFPSESRLKRYGFKNYRCYWRSDNLIFIAESYTNNTLSSRLPAVIYDIKEDKIYSNILNNYYLYDFSPDDKYVIGLIQKKNINLYRSKVRPVFRTMYVYAFPEMREAASFKYLLKRSMYRWQDNNTIAYIDENGKLQFLHVK